MDALKLRLRAKDQLHPILQELVTGFARFKGSKDWEGRSRMVSWWVYQLSHFYILPRYLYFSFYFPDTIFLSYVRGTRTLMVTCRLITLNGMKASEEITEEQSRQVRIHTHSSPSVSQFTVVTPPAASIRCRPRLRRVLQKSRRG
jgi:ESCRT-I complex subunit VPS28